jgi:hypothetical protein
VTRVVGEPARFAVEYDLNENHGGEWLFGRFCYWCGGQQIGDYALGTSVPEPCSNRVFCVSTTEVLKLKFRTGVLHVRGEWQRCEAGRL